MKGFPRGIGIGLALLGALLVLAIITEKILGEQYYLFQVRPEEKEVLLQQFPDAFSSAIGYSATIAIPAARVTYMAVRELNPPDVGFVSPLAVRVNETGFYARAVISVRVADRAALERLLEERDVFGEFEKTPNYAFSPR